MPYCNCGWLVILSCLLCVPVAVCRASIGALLCSPKYYVWTNTHTQKTAQSNQNKKRVLEFVYTVVSGSPNSILFFCSVVIHTTTYYTSKTQKNLYIFGLFLFTHSHLKNETKHLLYFVMLIIVKKKKKQFNCNITRIFVIFRFFILAFFLRTYSQWWDSYDNACVS